MTYCGPDVLSESWESDLANVLDDDIAESIAQDCDSPRCQSCWRNLHGEALYIETAPLVVGAARHSDETDAINPSRKLWNQVKEFYGRTCFAYSSDEASLEPDHIEPKSRGGKANFENLQRYAASAIRPRETTPHAAS